MRFHVPSLPWTETTDEYLSCAYTQKVVKFAQMMDSLGHEVIIYGGPQNQAPCSEHVVAITAAEQEKWFKTTDKTGISVNPNISWGQDDPHWKAMNKRVVRHIKKGLMAGKYEDTDVLCIISGWCQQPIAAELPQMTVAEWGIGYEGVVQRNNWHWCFESKAWQHYIYAKQDVVNGRWYDTVIPNSFDPDDFTFNPKKGDYILFLGRVMMRKGPDIGSAIAERLGMRYVVAGPGARQEGEMVVADERHLGPFKGEYVGAADKELRRELYANAALVMMPTLYIEPFGGVAVEAMFSGTPVLTSPWGAFGETVVEGVSGAHFHTIPQGVEAAKRAMKLRRSKVAKHAQRYSIWNVRHEYDAWFQRMDGLWSGRGCGDFYGDGAHEPS